MYPDVGKSVFCRYGNAGFLFKLAWPVEMIKAMFLLTIKLLNLVKHSDLDLSVCLRACR